MISDRDVCAAALPIVKRYGTEPPAEASDWRHRYLTER